MVPAEAHAEAVVSSSSALMRCGRPRTSHAALLRATMCRAEGL